VGSSPSAGSSINHHIFCGGFFLDIAKWF